MKNSDIHWKQHRLVRLSVDVAEASEPEGLTRHEAKAFRLACRLRRETDLSDAELIVRVRAAYPMPKRRVVEIVGRLVSRRAERVVRSRLRSRSMTVGSGLAVLEYMTDAAAAVAMRVGDVNFSDGERAADSLAARAGQAHEMMLWLHPGWRKLAAVTARRRRAVLRAPLNWRPKRMR